MSFLGVISLPPPSRREYVSLEQLWKSGAHKKQTPAMENKEDWGKHGLLRVPQRQGFREEAFPAWLNDSERQRV